MTSKMSLCSLLCATKSPRPRREFRRWVDAVSAFSTRGRFSAGLGASISPKSSKIRFFIQSNTSSRGSSSPWHASDSSDVQRARRHMTGRRVLKRVLLVHMTLYQQYVRLPYWDSITSWWRLCCHSVVYHKVLTRSELKAHSFGIYRYIQLASLYNSKIPILGTIQSSVLSIYRLRATKLPTWNIQMSCRKRLYIRKVLLFIDVTFTNRFLALVQPVIAIHIIPKAHLPYSLPRWAPEDINVVSPEMGPLTGSCLRSPPSVVWPV